MTHQPPPPMPAVKEAERVLLSQCLSRPQIIADVWQHVEPADFYSPANGALLELLVRMVADDTPIDPVTFPGEATRLGATWEQIGGITRVLELWDVAPASTNWRHYADQIRDAATRRRAIALLQQTTDRIYDRSEDADQLVDEALGQLGGLVDVRRRSDAGTLDDALLELEIEDEDRREGGIIPGLPTGLHALDEVVGIYPGDLVVFMAHTSHGKTATMLNVVRHLITKQDPVPVAVVSLEMDRRKLARRLISQYTRIEGARQRKGWLNADETYYWGQGVKHFRDRPLHIHHGSGLTINQVTGWVRAVDGRRRAAGLPGLGLVVVDYLQRLGQSDARQRRQEAVTAMSRGCKDLATRLELPVWVCAQPNREALKEQDKRPRLHHLRESGAIEQDADTVLAGYYHAKVVPDHQREKWENHYEIDILKQREGTTARVQLHFEPRCGRLRDLTHPELRARLTPNADDK